MSNENRIYKLNEIKDLAKKYNYRLGECLDGSGQKACTGHTTSVKPGIWIDKTLAPFTQRPNNDGIYYVYMYPDTRRKGKPDIYPIQIGKVAKNAPNGQINPPQVIVNHNLSENAQDNPLSWESALKYQNEIATLKADVTKLTLQLDSANEKIKNLEEEEPENLGEGAKNFFTDLLPVADQFMQNQKQARYLEFLKLASVNPQMLQHAGAFIPGQMQQQPMQQQQTPWNGLPKPGANNLQTDPTIIKAQEFIDSVSEADYAKIEVIKKGSPDLPIFFNNLAQHEPAIYEALYNFVNAE